MQDFQQDNDQESEEGLLKESDPSGEKAKFNRHLSQMPWCCKHVWVKSKKCRLAYCMKCKSEMLANVEKTKQKGDNMLGKTFLCCGKEKCGSHTLADLEDLIEMTVENDYLRNVRQKKLKKKMKGWENMPETCWNCGGFF